MSLFIRVELSFWNHRKTLRLRGLIGDAAFWVPPRLWAYAAANQADGDFSDYSDEEIEMLVGYVGHAPSNAPSNAPSMLQALQQAGFMDGKKVHDWEEHNSYHVTFSERAKAAAKARWEKEKTGEESTREEKTKHCLEHEQAMLQAFGTFWEAYPRKQAKEKAEAAWRRVPAKLHETIMFALAKAKKSDDWTKDGGKFIPYPASWLNGKRWQDFAEASNVVRDPVFTVHDPEAVRAFRAKMEAKKAANNGR